MFFNSISWKTLNKALMVFVFGASRSDRVHPAAQLPLHKMPEDPTKTTPPTVKRSINKRNQSNFKRISWRQLPT